MMSRNLFICERNIRRPLAGSSFDSTSWTLRYQLSNRKPPPPTSIVILIIFSYVYRQSTPFVKANFRNALYLTMNVIPYWISSLKMEMPFVTPLNNIEIVYILFADCFVSMLLELINRMQIMIFSASVYNVVLQFFHLSMDRCDYVYNTFQWILSITAPY